MYADVFRCMQTQVQKVDLAACGDKWCKHLKEDDDKGPLACFAESKADGRGNGCFPDTTLAADEDVPRALQLRSSQHARRFQRAREPNVRNSKNRDSDNSLYHERYPPKGPF